MNFHSNLSRFHDLIKFMFDKYESFIFLKALEADKTLRALRRNKDLANTTAFKIHKLPSRGMCSLIATVVNERKEFAS